MFSDPYVQTNNPSGVFIITNKESVVVCFVQELRPMIFMKPSHVAHPRFQKEPHSAANKLVSFPAGAGAIRPHEGLR